MKQIGIDFDTAKQKAAKGANGGRTGQNTHLAKKIWADVRASTRTGLGWAQPARKMAE
jgi:hypothetical protein